MPLARRPTEGSRIGPYRILRRIGGGGMGVVYEAFDDRLERRVAIKVLRRERTDDPKAVKRFRFEAKAAAQLSHPAIVQIHDLVEGDEGDSLVLEFVEGEPLSRRPRAAPLASATVARLGREIAEGLAAAHARGIVHRDLKAENVVLTPEGHAKILDFGLARLGSAAAGAGLSETGVLMGTFRAMAPEQVSGQPAEPRSDLFSLGVLLYELATAVSPFEAGDPLATLKRLCTHEPPPAHEVNPALPPALSALIGHLLEKDPARRPASAREVAERLAALGGEGTVEEPAARAEGDTLVDGRRPAYAAGRLLGGLRRLGHRRAVWTGAALAALAVTGLFLWRAFIPGEPVVVAVAAPRLAGAPGGQEGELAASALRGAVLAGLAALDGVAALEPEPGEAAPPSATGLAAALAADEVLASRLDCRPEICRVTLSRLAGGSGAVRGVEAFEAPLDEPGLLAAAVATGLGRLFAGHRMRRGVRQLEAQSEDYARLLRLREAFDRRGESTDLRSLLAAAQAVAAGSPRFLEARLFLADVASWRFFETRDAADLEQALAQVGEARALAPGDPRPLLAWHSVAIRAERLDEAEEAARQLARLVPGDPQLLALEALNLERRGRGREALALLHKAARRRPAWRNLFSLANLAHRQGDAAAARAALGELLARSPGHLRGLTLLAQIELLAGRPERAAELYVELVGRSRGFAELSNLGLAWLLQGRSEEAVAAFREARALAPRSAMAALNLADGEELAGRAAEAEALYREALALAADDPAPSLWQVLTLRAQALAHLGERRQAVAAIQQALAEAPHYAQVAFEASLVYALVGDQASALVHAERAARGGVGASWFRLPWFDALRSDPAFAALAEAGS